jgi:hypothetical protein
MDRTRGSVVAAIALAVTAVSWSSGAHATSLKFQMQGDDNYTWTMDSDPTPVGATDGGSWAFSGAPGAPGDALNFFNLSETGGLNAVSFLNGPTTEIFDYIGPQVYSGLETAPHFDVGLFTFVTNVLTHRPANETLRISLAPTPIPAALPLFASALGGLGFVGWRRKKAAPAA